MAISEEGQRIIDTELSPATKRRAALELEAEMKPQPDDVFKVGPRANSNPINTARTDKLFDRRSQEEKVNKLFEEAPSLVDKSVAGNYGHMEAVLFDDPPSYEARKLARMRSTVFDRATEIVKEEYAAGRLREKDIFDPDNPLTTAERMDATIHELYRIDHRKYDPYRKAIIAAMMMGAGKMPLDRFEGSYYDMSALDVDAVTDRLTIQQRERGRRVINDVVASKGFTNYGDMAVNFFATDLIPIYNEWNRWFIAKSMEEIIEDISGKPIGSPFNPADELVPSEIRQNIRTALVELGPEQYNEAVKRIAIKSDELLNSPIWGPLLTKYGYLEFMENTFTEGVLTGQDDKNTIDRIVGDVAFGLELIFSAALMRAFGQGMRGMIRATDASTYRQAARITNQTKARSQFDVDMQYDDVAAEWRMPADDAVPVLLPRPTRFVNDIDELPDGAKRVLERSERIRSELLETSDGFTGAGLNVRDKRKVLTQELEKLDVADGIAYPHVAMSAIRMLPNETGLDLNIILGETVEGGWASFDDAVDALFKMDPQGELFELVRITDDGIIGPVFANREEFLRAAFKVDAPISAAPNQPGLRQDFYLRYNHQRFWHNVDKKTMGPETFQNTGLVPRILVPPNGRLGSGLDDIYGSFANAYIKEQQLVKNFEFMFKPFYDLNVKDKRFVTSAFEWMEDFGKNHGRAPEIVEIYAKYDGITESQVKGMIAVRAGYDVMHELFNRRLYREFSARGFRTARPRQSNLPTFHGLSLERAQVRPGQFLDPLTGEGVQLRARDLDDLYNSGDSIMELDIAVSDVLTARSQYDRVIVGPGRGYELGELSTRPLVYYPGYHFRFYDDPYFIVKHTDDMSVNGQLSGIPVKDAIRTAGTKLEGEGFAKRLGDPDPKTGRWNDRKDANVSYEVVRARDISQTENTLMQKQTLHREGRLFWDDRNFDRLPDVNNNRSSIEDFVPSLEKGIAIIARQLTHEDLLKGFKGAFYEEYGDLVKRGSFDVKSMGEIVKELKATRANTSSDVLKQRYNEAIELVNYFRLISGTESTAIPKLREQMIALGYTFNRLTKDIPGSMPVSRMLDRYAQQMDPTRTMRSVAFHAFMVFRPFRQALLQSLQISYLAPLDPLYVGSGRVFGDAIALRVGVATLRDSAFNTGMSKSKWAKVMGLSAKEYTHLIKQFERSGLLELVNVHSFAGGARRFNKQALPNSAAGMVGYRGKQLTVGLRDFMQRIGFDWGERNNLTFTYMIALRRHMKKNKLKSVLDVDPRDWDVIGLDASNLALGMMRPNNFGYQTGLASVGTQFISFMHKAAMGILGQNPAITKLQGIKILMGTYLLFGANMFGSRDWVEQQLTIMGVADAQIPGIEGATLVDLISAGIIETTINKIMEVTMEDTKDIDLGFLAPGVNAKQIWQMQIETIIKQPAMAVLGAFGNVMSNTLESYAFASWYASGNPDMSPVDEFAFTADAMLRGFFPSYNDVMMAHLGWHMNNLFATSGEALPIRPTMDTLIARGMFGARSIEELNYYELQSELYDNQQAIDDIVEENKKYLVRLINLKQGGELTRDLFHQYAAMLNNMMQGWPEGVRTVIRERSFMEDLKNGDPSVAAQLVEAMDDGTFRPDMNYMIDNMPDIPPAERERLKQLAEEAWSSFEQLDKRELEKIEEQQ